MKIPTPENYELSFRDPVWEEVGRQIFADGGLKISAIRRPDSTDSVVFFGDEKFVLKLYHPAKNGFDREMFALEEVGGKLPFDVARIVRKGEFEGYQYAITTRIPGRLVTRSEWLKCDRTVQVDFIDKLAAALQTLHSLDAGKLDFDWSAFIRSQTAGAVERQRSEGGNPEWIASLPRFIEEYLHLIPLDGNETFLHGDVHFGNLRILDDGGCLKIAGLFDFADCLRGFHEYEFIAVGVLMIQGQGDLQREFFRRYGYSDSELNEEMRKRMMMLTIFYEWSSLRRYAERLRPDAVNLTLAELERAIWSFA